MPRNYTSPKLTTAAIREAWSRGECPWCKSQNVTTTHRIARLTHDNRYRAQTPVVEYACADCGASGRNSKGGEGK